MFRISEIYGLIALFIVGLVCLIVGHERNKKLNSFGLLILTATLCLLPTLSLLNVVLAIIEPDTIYVWTNRRRAPDFYFSLSTQPLFFWTVAALNMLFSLFFLSCYSHVNKISANRHLTTQSRGPP